MNARQEVAIRRLVLSGVPEGVPPAWRAAVAEAFSAELARLLAERPASGGAAPARPVTVPAQAAGPAELGRLVARAVHGRLAP